MPRPLRALLAVVLSGFGMSACGSAHEGVVAESRSSHGGVAASGASATASATLTGRYGERDGDGDYDSRSGGPYDGDDNVGRPASIAELRTITALVKRYYALAAAGDGVAACLLLRSTLAEAVAEEATVQACAAVVSGIFRQHRRQLVADAPSLRVARVRVEGDRGWAFLRFGATSGRRMLVHREDGAWKIDSVLDVGVP